MNKYGLTEKEQVEILALIKKYPEIDEVILFGSRAMNTFTKISDIDLALKGDNISRIIGSLVSDFEDSSLIYEVDVIDYHGISSEALLEHIRKYGKVFYRKGWVETTLGEVVSLVGGGTPKTTIKEYWNGDIPWLSVVDFNNEDRWVSKTEKTITEKGLTDSSAKLLNTGDIIISARGTVGALAQLKKQMAFNQSCYGIKEVKNISNKDFLFYLIKYSLKQINKNTHGAVFDTITRQTFNNININLPPLPEQKAIAAVLSAFDDKIELLREQNQTLETLAQTIFKEWFVHFNFPGKDGKPYRDNGGEMADSELGKIPKGWRVGKLGEVTHIRGGGTPSTKKEAFWNGDIHWTSPKDLSNTKSIFLLDTEKKITPEGLKKISSGLLPKGTLLLSSRAPIGYVAISNVDIAINQGYIALLNDAYFSNYYMLFWLKTHMKAVTNAANGSTFLEISKTAFRNIECIIPGENVLKDFDEFGEPVLDKILKNIKQIQTLSKIRDTLLPKLMNGTIRVKIE